MKNILGFRDGNIRIRVMDLHIVFHKSPSFFFDFNRFFPFCQFSEMIGLYKKTTGIYIAFLSVAPYNQNSGGMCRPKHSAKII
jgi:hypothetical protein